MSSSQSSEQIPLLRGRLISAEARENIFHAETKSAITVQIGLLVLIVTIFSSIFLHPIIPFFAPHPILNSLGLAFLSNALLVTQPPPLSIEHKIVKGRIHGILNSFSVTFFTGGFISIYYNKIIHGALHFTTWHGIFGLFTVSLLILTFMFGLSIYWLPEQIYGSVSNAKYYYKFHRIAGYFVFSLINVTILLALDSDYNKNVLHICFYTVIPSILVIWLGITSGLSLSRLI